MSLRFELLALSYFTWPQFGQKTYKSQNTCGTVLRLTAWSKWKSSVNFVTYLWKDKNGCTLLRIILVRAVMII